ncbi:MAG: hypothetical protein HQL68_00375 [Magnetococcales bacterium]|nr:hypothetical protein [Magnetococcales bacterium]
MSPMFHRLADRVEAHVKICVLALLIERVVELTCEQPWPRVREILRTLQISEYHTENFQFFQRNLPTSKVSDIFKKLETPLPKRVYNISTRSDPVKTV